MTEEQAVQATEGVLARAEFRGRAGEYFGIWIVNILLTIVTVGIYSAWAKVRRNRYFYGNTVFLDRSFEYHATGKQIFIGRLIVFVFISMMNVITNVYPLAAIGTTLIILAALPWAIVRSLRFNARVTTWRNIQFDFKGSVKGAFFSLVLGSLMSFISLGLLAPLATRWIYRYVGNNLRYGDRAFATDPQLKSLYGALLLPAMLVLAGAAIFGLIVASIWATTAEAVNGIDSEPQAMLAIIAIIYAVLFCVLLVYGVAGMFYRIAVRNIVCRATFYDGQHQLFSDVGRFRYVWIAISNIIIVVLTLGLMRPWAAVRTARYMVSHTGVIVKGDPGEVLSDIEATGSAVSAEFMDMEGFDFGF